MTCEEADAALRREAAHDASGGMAMLALIQRTGHFLLFLSRVTGHTVDRGIFKGENGHRPAFNRQSLRNRRRWQTLRRTGVVVHWGRRTRSPPISHPPRQNETGANQKSLNQRKAVDLGSPSAKVLRSTTVRPSRRPHFDWCR